MDELTLTLHHPLTDKEWDDITDVDFEHTNEITFYTKNGKEVAFAKKPHWISCSERLPDGSQIVLLTLPKYIDDYGQKFYASVICGHYIGGKDCEWGISDGSMVGYGLVSARYGVSPIAWMPLPSPYQSESEG